jgi:hypothetical protein
MSRLIVPVRIKLQAIAQMTTTVLTALDDTQTTVLTSPDLSRVLRDLEEGGARVMAACTNLSGVIDSQRSYCT